MTQELRQLINEVIEKEEIGTLFLGRGNRMRRAFFSGTGVHLLEVARSVVSSRPRSSTPGTT